VIWACREETCICCSKKSLSDGGESYQKYRGRPRTTMRKTIINDQYINELDLNMIYDIILRRNLIHIIDLILFSGIKLN